MARTRARWLTPFVVAGVIATATSPGAQMREEPPFAREIAEAADRHGVPERLICAVIRVESGFERRAVSRRGARGLMQLMPETAAILGVRDPFDPRQNIDGGTRHLRGLLVRFRYDLPLALAAYNVGEKPVLAYRGVPPYPETRQYVAQVLRFYNEPVASRRAPGGDVHRILQRDGTVVYTNIAFGRLAGDAVRR